MKVGVDPYAEIYKQMLRERKLDEAASKKRRKRKSAQLRQVSFAPKFQEGVKALVATCNWTKWIILPCQEKRY